MTHLIALLLAALLGPASAPPPPLVASLGPAQGPVVALMQPTPPPDGEAPPRRVSAAVWLALVCVFNLSLVALLGAIALRRHIDRISPDK
ncbi:MAG TPA: hypothetical protein PKD53_26880 [Chloroflexaceae bacterium]|nr:hypothetical protein [Chloroflexaceae bacterium]